MLAASLVGCESSSVQPDDAGDASSDAELPDAGVDGGDAGPEDAGDAATDGAPGDGGDGGGEPDAGPPVMVRFTVPTATRVYVTDADYFVQVTVDMVVDRVDLFVDGQLHANLDPPYQYDILADGLSEGEHVVMARARLGTRTFDSAPFTLVVDRSLPFVTKFDPAPFPLLPTYHPVELIFDAPLTEPSSITISARYTSDNATISGTTTRDGDARFVFVPSSRLQEGRTVRFFANGTVWDLAGNARTLSAYAINWNVWAYWASPLSVGQLARVGHANENGDFYFPGRVGSEIRIRGRIWGATPTPPALEAPYDAVAFVQSGLDEDGNAFLFYRATDTETTTSAHFVAWRDPASHTWTQHTLPIMHPMATVEWTRMVVAGNGYAFVRIAERVPVDEMTTTVVEHTYTRAPGAAMFTYTNDFDASSLGDWTAFPGHEGRTCDVEIKQVEPANGDSYVAFVCRGAARPTNVVMVGAPAASLPARSWVVNARGDALLRVGTLIYDFDGDTETVSEPIDLGGLTGIEMGLGINGHRCIAVHVASSVDVRTRGPNDDAYSSPVVLQTGVVNPLLSWGHVGVDAAGHCFAATRPLFIVAGGTPTIAHNATPDGAWQVGYPYGSADAMRVLAGGPSQAFVLTGNGDALSYRAFQLPP